MAGSFTRHGDVGTPLHDAWTNMLSRCRNGKHPQYKDYGGRGISVCKAWTKYLAFRDWALKNGYVQGLMLDRKNNNGNYEPDNCRFVDRIVSNNNRRYVKQWTAFGEKKSRAEWSRDCRCIVPYMTIVYRLSRGWTMQKAITTPPTK